MSGPITTTSINVLGIDGYAQSTTETAGQVFNNYTTAVNTISNLLIPAHTLTTANLNTLNQQLNILRNLLMNGASVSSDPQDPNGSLKTYYLTTQMAQHLGVLFASLSSANVDFSAAAPIQLSLAQANTWQSNVNAAPLLQSLIQFVGSTSNKSIQSMIELNYVKTGNDMIAAQMGNLEDALNTTQQTLNILATLQEAHNQIQVNSKSSFTSVTHFNPGGASALALSPSAFVTKYGSAASAFFGSRITPSVTSSPSDPYIMSPDAAWLFKAISDTATLLANFPVAGGGGGGGTPHFTDTLNYNAATGVYQIFVFAIPDIPSNIFSQNNGSVVSDGGFIPSYTISFTGAELAASVTKMISIYNQGVTNPGTYTLSSANGNSLITIPSDVDRNIFAKGFKLFQVGVVNTKNQLAILLGQLSALLPQLSGTVPRVGVTSTNAGVEDPAGLTAKIRTVYSDLKTVFVTRTGARITSGTSMGSALSGLTKWLLDGYNTPQNTPSASRGGAFQQHITYAITAGQSLNDSQNEKVRQFLYVFEEYYKSASAILQALTQILQHMAQNIK